MRHRLLLAALPVIAACTGRPPAPPAPVAAVAVAAPFAATWDAVVDIMASQNIPITTIDRASGFVATSELAVGPEGKAWADCGTGGGNPFTPERATYNVRVRETPAGSTVQATVRWTSEPVTGMVITCSTTGQWETAFAGAVKAAAESHASH